MMTDDNIYGGLVSALGSDKAQVVPTDCWVTQI
jgi:hypothetical protein